MLQPIKLTAGQWAALRWLKESPGLLLPHTTNPPYCDAWKDHKPAAVQSFYSLERRGLAERREWEGFWHLTRDGEVLSSGLTISDNNKQTT